MSKRFSAALLLAAAAAYLIWTGYRAKNIGLLLWGIALVTVTACLPKTFLRNGFVVVASLLLTLALAESGLPLLRSLATGEFDSAYYDPDASYTVGYFRESAFGSQPRPGIFTSRRLTRSGDTIYEARYSIGSDRFRVTPGADRGTEEQQLNFFGCSFTFGEGLDDDETLPYYTGTMLPGYRIRNFGLHGWGVHQALAVLETRPDRNQINFLLTVPWHAERSACLPAYGMGSPRYVMGPDGIPTRDGICGEAIYRLPRPLRTMLTESKLYRLYVSRQFRNQDRDFELYLGIMKRMKSLSDERNSKFIVGFMKMTDTYFRGTYSNERIVTTLEGWGIPVIDMTLAATATEVSPRYYHHSLDKHPTALANSERATLLAGYLRGNPPPADGMERK